MTEGTGLPANLSLRALTPARVDLGRTGVSLPTAAHLDFQLAHARARDAVHRALDVAATEAAIAALGYETVAVRSAAADRQTYLGRPDLGRRLDGASRARLAALPPSARGADVAFVVADGLAAPAAATHAVTLLGAIRPSLRAAAWRTAPVAVAEQGRVALGDEIGEALAARIVVVLIGERPGLSAPESLGAYLTWYPRPGRTDAERNCISNIRPEGLPPGRAAGRLWALLAEARRRGISGVGLKEG